jgi:hypothetical protein
VVENERGNNRVVAQPSDKSCCFPMAVRHIVDQPRAFPAPPSQSRHLGVGARLVDKDQLFGIKRGLRLALFLAGCGDVGPQLLAGVQRFFIGHATALEKSRYRAVCDRHSPFLPDRHDDLGKRSVAAALDKSE